jgi:hypothetical protein
MLVTKALPHDVAILAFVPLLVPAGPSAHAFPAEVATCASIN